MALPQLPDFNGDRAAHQRDIYSQAGMPIALRSHSRSTMVGSKAADSDSLKPIRTLPALAAFDELRQGVVPSCLNCQSGVVRYDKMWLAFAK